MNITCIILKNLTKLFYFKSMKKIYLVAMMALFSILTYAQYSVPLKVVDYQESELTDDLWDDPEEGYLVTPYVTTGTRSKLLETQTPINFSANPGIASTTLTVNSSQRYQTIDGFGFCMTQGSAEAILSLTPAKQEQLLNDLFHPVLGIGSSMVRISIGASDLSSFSYSYNETNGDVQMNNFSLDGPDKDFLIPILKRALAINPDLKFLATPWTAPRWMKTNNGWIGGRLKTEYYEAYANYFVKYFQAMEAEGINIWGITPQNEPENPNNEPSLSMNSAEQKSFINNNLGPAMASAGYDHIKIIAFDHNCDNTAYPIDVLNNSTYVDGAAFHLYSGDISAMSTVKNATNKNVYFTEQYTGVGGDFSGDFGWHMEFVGIGSVNNWSKTVIEWNVATDEFFGPRTPGGCTTCQGAFTVNSSSNYNTNVSYYIVGQFSKFVKDGATRIGLSGANSNVVATAFQNPDGSFAVVAYNTSGVDQSVKIERNGEGIVFNIPRKSAATFVWREGPAVPVESIAITPSSGTLEEGQTIKPALVFTPENSTNKGVQWSSDDASVAMVSGEGTVIAKGEGGNNCSCPFSGWWFCRIV